MTSLDDDEQQVEHLKSILKDMRKVVKSVFLIYSTVTIAFSALVIYSSIKKQSFGQLPVKIRVVMIVFLLQQLFSITY